MYGIEGDFFFFWKIKEIYESVFLEIVEIVSKLSL